MPHKCLKCSALYPDAAQETIQGCACGAKAFLYVRERKRKAKEEHAPSLETIRMESDGKYHLDVERMLDRSTTVYRESDGKYHIDLEQSFKKHLKGNRNILGQD